MADKPWDIPSYKKSGTSVMPWDVETYKKPGPPPGSMPWSDVLPTMGKNLSADWQSARDIAADPTGSLISGAKAVPGYVGDAARVVVSGMPGNLWNNFLDPIRGAEPGGPLDAYKITPGPDMKRASAVGQAIANEIAHPIESLANRPLGTAFDAASLVAGKAGIGALRSASVPADIETSLNAARKATSLADEAIKTNTNRFPVKPIQRGILDALKGNDPQLPAPANSIIDTVMNLKGYKSLEQLRELRKYVSNPDSYSKLNKSEAVVPSDIGKPLTDAFDAAIRQVYPRAAGLIDQYTKTTRAQKNVETIGAALKGGQLKGVVSGQEGKALQKELSKVLTSPSKTHGMYPETVDALTNSLVKSEQPQTTMGSIISTLRQGTGPTLAPLIGAAAMSHAGGNGLWGAILGSIPLASAGVRQFKLLQRTGKLKQGLLELAGQLAEVQARKRRGLPSPLLLGPGATKLGEGPR